MPNVTIPAENRRLVEAKYIQSLFPVFWTDLSKHDDNEFISDDAFGHKLTNTGTSWRMNGRYADGASYLTFPLNGTLQNLNSMSVFVWQKADTPVSALSIFSQYDTGANQRKWNITSGGAGNRDKFIVVLSTAGTLADKNYQSSVSVVNGSYHMMGFAFDAPNSILTIYADGVPDPNPTKTSDTAITSLFASTVNVNLFLQLNSGATAAPWIGVGNQFFIFNRALMPATVQQLYTQTKWRYI